MLMCTVAWSLCLHSTPLYTRNVIMHLQTTFTLYPASRSSYSTVIRSCTSVNCTDDAPTLLQSS